MILWSSILSHIKHVAGRVNMRSVSRNSTIMIVLVILCVQIFFDARSDAQNKNVAREAGSAIIKNLSEKFDKIQSYIADANIVIGNEHKKELHTAKIYYNKPNLFRMEIYSNDRLVELITKNKKIKWHYIDIIKTVFKYENSQEEANNVSINDVIMTFYNRKKLEYLGKKDVDGVLCECYAFNLLNDKQENRVTIYINPANGMFKKIKMSEANSSFSVEETFKNVRINANIDDSKFTYAPANNIQVVEVGEDQRYGVVRIPSVSKNKS